MIELDIDEFAKIVSGQVRSRVHETFKGYGTDTRKPLKDQLFIALKGDRFDGHDFLAKALEQGAACVLVSSVAQLKEPDLAKVSVVEVQDTLIALQQLATWWRKKNNFQVVGITGSNGKTTTKRILLTLLEGNLKAFGAKGSFNNHWGVPFTILDTPADAEVLVLEMGMNALGEIKKLCKIAEPDVVTCTMVGTAHLGELGSQENIKKAKWEIYENSPMASKVFNYDNEFTLQMLEDAKTIWPDENFLLFSSFRKEAQVFLRAMDSSLEGLAIQGVIGGQEGRSLTKILGRQNVVNLGAATGVALALGLTPDEIWARIPAIEGEWGRNQLLETESGGQILFDGYNANPDSMAILLKNLFEMFVSGKKIAILGEMFELGDFADEKHEQLGEMIANTDVVVVWFLGPSGPAFERGLKAAGFAKTYFISEGYEESLASKLGSMLQDQDIAVIKGSRGMRLERIVQAFKPLNFGASKS